MPSVKVTCPCGNRFVTSAPPVVNQFIVICPICGTKLRLNSVNFPVNQSMKSERYHEADRVASQIRNYEFALGIVWLILGVLQLVFSSYIVGAWNIYWGITRLLSTKNIYAGNTAVIPWYVGQLTSLIIFSVLNLIAGSIIGNVLMALDWWVRDYALKNKPVFEGHVSQSTY